MMRYNGFETYAMMNNEWGWLMMLVFFVLIVLGIGLLFKYIKGLSSSVDATNSKNVTDKATNSSAIEILNERYARGEITSEEYYRIKSDIK